MQGWSGLAGRLRGAVRQPLRRTHPSRQAYPPPRIVEHVAGAEDFQIAMATYHAARKRWPKAAMTLRQDTRVIEDSRRTRIGTLFSFPWSEKGREGGGR